MARSPTLSALSCTSRSRTHSRVDPLKALRDTTELVALHNAGSGRSCTPPEPTGPSWEQIGEPPVRPATRLERLLSQPSSAKSGYDVGATPSNTSTSSDREPITANRDQTLDSLHFLSFSATSHLATSTNFMLVCCDDSTSIANAGEAPISKRSMRMPLA